MLTLSACTCSSVQGEVGTGGNGARRSSVGVGEDEDEGDDSELPATIPWTRKKREARRSRQRPSICSGRPRSTAMRRRLDLGHGHVVSRVRVRERGK